jgi:hypothetical protein
MLKSENNRYDMDIGEEMIFDEISIENTERKSKFSSAMSNGGHG